MGVNFNSSILSGVLGVPKYVKLQNSNQASSNPILNEPIKDTVSLNTVSSNFQKVKNEQGAFGRLWDGFKNLTGFGYSSKDVEIDIQRYHNGEITAEEAIASIEKFSQKQSGMLDLTANMISGLVVAGSAILTGGTSLLGGAAIGGVVKAGIKTADRATNKIDGDAANAKQIVKDVVTGAVDGAVTIGTAGMVKGPIVGQTVKQAVKTSVIQGAKAGAISGAAAGAASYTVEAATEKDVKFSLKDFASTTIQGGVVGGALGGATSGISGGLSQAKFNTPEVMQLADNFHIEAGDVKGSEALSRYLSKNRNMDVSDLNHYIDNIDRQQLYSVSPKTADYSTEQLMNFYDYHYKAGTEVFDADALTMDGDFTKFLRENYVDKKQMSELLDIFPETSRYVGEMPNGWLSNVPLEQQSAVQEQVYAAIKQFQSGNGSYRSMAELSENLSKILGKDVSIKELGSGCFGTGYKVSMEGAEDTVLKIFNGSTKDDLKKMFDFSELLSSEQMAKLRKLGITEDRLRKIGEDYAERMTRVHGQHIETQTGLFVNEHSDDFVRMYFGKVSGTGDADGFLVTQFLSDDVVPQSPSTVKGGYRIKSKDAWAANSKKGKIYGQHNIINGKIIDYGAVQVKQTGFNGFIQSLKSFFVAA